MAYMTQNIAASAGLVERFLASAARLLETAAERRAKRRVFRDTLNELNALSNRELADLGLHRSHLTKIALDAAEGRKPS